MALRRLLLSALTGIALVGAGSAPPAAALPVGGSSRDLDELHRWSSGPETTVRYYNVCNDNLNEIEYESDERFGVVYDPVSTGELYETWWYFFLSSGTGYGSACTIDVMRVDENLCPTGEPLASRWFVPRSYWNIVEWDGVKVGAEPFALVATVVNPGLLATVTDYPGPGPGGPEACGTCVPLVRPVHSFYWGTENTALCPGEPLDGGICTAELIVRTRVTVTSLEPRSWSRLKELYR